MTDGPGEAGGGGHPLLSVGRFFASCASASSRTSWQRCWLSSGPPYPSGWEQRRDTPCDQQLMPTYESEVGLRRKANCTVRQSHSLNYRTVRRIRHHVRTLTLKFFDRYSPPPVTTYARTGLPARGAPITWAAWRSDVVGWRSDVVGF